MIRFADRPFPVQSTRSGRYETIHRPILPIQIFGPAGSDEDEGLVDTGSDDTLFPDDRIGKLGVTIKPGDHAVIAGIEGSLTLVRYGAVDLAIPGPGGGTRWSARVGFHSGQKVVLGLGGSLESSRPASTAGRGD